MKDRDRIERLIAEYEVRLSQLRGTLALLALEDNGRGRPAKHPGASAALTAAIALQAERNGNGAGHGKAKHGHGKYVGKGTATSVKERRRRTLDLLNAYDREHPRNVEGAARMGLGSLVRRGYLRAKGDGYVRTAKEYVP